MNTHTSAVAMCLLLSGLMSHGALGEPGQAGPVFKLELKPLPGERASGLGCWGTRLSPAEQLPEGIKAGQAMKAELQLQDGNARRRVLVTRPAKGKAPDRLYVDLDGDQKFGQGECFDIRRSNGIVTTKMRGSNYHEVFLRPVRFTGVDSGDSSPRWLVLWLRDYRRENLSLLFTSVTTVAGRLKFGEREVPLAFYVPLRFSKKGIRIGRVEFGKRAGPRGGTSLRGIGSIMFIDHNANGRFDGTSTYDMSTESRRRTRLVRVDGKYYELDVSAKDMTARVALVSPKTGTLRLPEGLESISVFGPEFAMAVPKGTREVELPVGEYVVYRYRYKTPKGTLSAQDFHAAAVFEIRADEVTRIKAGPPLELAVSHRWVRSTRRSAGSKARRPESVRFELPVRDCAGREITDVRTPKGSRPHAPKIKIVDSKGKTILSHAFKYG